jgi:hypothetical protein
MPPYGDLPSKVGATGQGATSLVPGDRLALFNAETVTAPQSSIAVARGYNPAGGAAVPMVFTIHFAAAPTASVLIQGSNVDVDAQYQTVFTSTGLQDENYTDYGIFQFYRAQLASQSAGGALTVIVQR